MDKSRGWEEQKEPFLFNLLYAVAWLESRRQSQRGTEPAVMRTSSLLRFTSTALLDRMRPRSPVRMIFGDDNDNPILLRFSFCFFLSLHSMSSS